MKKNFAMNKPKLLTVVLLGALLAPQAQAAIALDRTRVIFDGSEKSVSLNISNQNKQLPYLAQGWLEDEQGNKIQSPLAVLPPVQRVEPGKPSQVKIQALPATKLLPQDRETLYYFNLREIPPKSDKPNTLQIALQTRIKLFYRPAAIAPQQNAAPWQEQLTLTRQGDKFVVNNPTPYYVTLVDAGAKKGAVGVKDFEPLMVPPKGSAPLGASAAALGAGPVLTYINDYGGRPQLNFNCSGSACQVVPEKSKS
ncbi:Chaperone protein papD precursor [Serratia marcescens]|jgi:P pilus assembly protein, chaperone PapD|uniref:fimbria/pilus periplasmic chaperone n=1 Tax=Serratia marcescens TaxID=615 RepID=UPI0018D6735C|nr:fimbria/pilus periplasmic chaperone [Serratia marcescens]MBH2526192.1 fimbria/pilus periplasmic chaperone [Serratia marcescens]MBH2888062.1 fimbria/pilus periplasmic chaperone [Serratia marcescens]MBH2998644.1 fimbria/pilus periplasmic chaperone [Serratia marcescens]MBH3137830.1 fimbria/pilus periplasmic chaperone [Serratia marcescens]MDU4305578.1 fimbria/pilus periplasmic chaperone [Serratia marcescens]